ncbi:MAG: hypothetical protein FWE03_05100 [Firmicutes bacterium]|nr:hypothetical protein [Bacillota bacterium]
MSDENNDEIITNDMQNRLEYNQVFESIDFGCGDGIVSQLSANPSNYSPNYITKGKTYKENLRQILKNATNIPSEWTKVRFAKIYGGRVMIAPAPKDFETAQEMLWRYFVVRVAIDKTKLKQMQFIPKKYLPLSEV